VNKFSGEVAGMGGGAGGKGLTNGKRASKIQGNHLRRTVPRGRAEAKRGNQDKDLQG